MKLDKFKPNTMIKIRRNITLALIFFAFNFQTHAQLKLKQYLLAGSCVLASGMIDGTIESMTWHYEEGFKKRLPKINDHFWNPATSWKNKYKNDDPAQGARFFGSTNVFVFTTDGYHLLRTVSRTINGITLAYYINETCHEKELSKRKKWLRIGRDFLILTAIRTAGFQLTYSLLFRK